MADVMTNCFPGVAEQVAGRVVIRSYLQPSAIQTIEPVHNTQMASGVFDEKYTNRFNHPRYYYGDTAN
jgi:hypothetical protein